MQNPGLLLNEYVCRFKMRREISVGIKSRVMRTIKSTDESRIGATHVPRCEVFLEKSDEVRHRTKSTRGQVTFQPYEK